jgi:long-subunit acyl-CoA synthetase (AMP-forming)
MLNCIPIRVESYSGGRADQEPRVLCRGGRRLEVAAIVDRWFQGGTDPAAGWAEMPPVADIPPDTAASIIYTSGTTGLAKGGVLSHRGIIANINAAATTARWACR